jgi:serralysin
VTIYGTSGADHIVGTSGNDVIDGGVGPDTISGGLGNDTYIVNDARDMIVESFNGGVDTVRTSLSTYTLGNQLDNLTLTGTSAQTGTGNDLNNVVTDNGFKSTLIGAGGNDTLVSNGGLDTMTGGAGKDVFQFNKLASGPDTITDFSKGNDQLNLHNLLTSYHGTNPVADHWVKFTSDSTGTTVYVDSDGPTGSAGFSAVVKLAGLHATLVAGSDWIF